MMLDQLNIKLNNFGPISSADIDISKINIVGGLNSTGKSTCSKILYSLLRSNSQSRKRLSETTLVPEILQVGFLLINFSNTALEDDEDSEKVRDEIKEIMDEMTDKIENNVSPEEFGVIDYFDKLNNIYQQLKIKEDYKNIIDNSFSNVQKLVDIYNEDGNALFESLMNQLVKREFGKNLNELKDVNFTGKFNDASFDYSLNIADSKFNTEGWFIVEDVFYFDSFSTFDIVSRGGLQNTEHIAHLFQSLDDDESSEWGDEIINDNLIEIENKIMDITGGRFLKDDKNIIFIASEKEFLMKNTSSGIKQLGIIQMLLNNRKLSENSFLIMDEPEVNLHPEWQVKFAEIIILLAKELNITIYINTHSPLFIEAMRTYAKKYGILDDTAFYLTIESDIKNKFTFEKISSDELHIIYNTLGKPYELLSKISIEADFGI